MSDETRFPDPRGEDRSPKPTTAKQWIDHAINDLKENFIWEIVEGSLVCHICTPGGYKLRQGASMDWHANQRNPPTHSHNLIWATIQWFKAHNMPVPTWPDCYRASHDGFLFCHICRESVDVYDEDHGRRHDQYHVTLEQRIMRPNRIKAGPGRANIRAASAPAPQQPQQRRRHILDDLMAIQRGDMTPGATVHSSDSYEEPGEYSRGLSRIDQAERDRYTMVTTAEGIKRIANEELDRFEADPTTGEMRRLACMLYDLCAYPPNPSILRPCIGDGCACGCHRDNG